MTPKSRPERRRRRYREEGADALLRAARAVVALVVMMSAVLVWRPAIDQFSLPRATITALAVIVLAVFAAARSMRDGEVVIPKSPATVLACAFVAAMALSVALSSHPMLSIVGPYTRYTGLAMYAAYAALLIAVLGTFDRPSVRHLALVATAGLVVVAGYGLVQLVGADPVDWGDAEQTLVDRSFTFDLDFSTLGNVNFAAAFVAMCVPLALWAALNAEHARPVRLGAAMTAVAGLVYGFGTGSFQGPIGISLGVAVPIAVWLVDRRPWRTLSRRGVLGVLAATALVVAVAGILVVPTVRDEVSSGLEERTQLWETAGEIWLDSPVWGHGPGAFTHRFLAQRPIEHAVDRRLQSADAPHNVVLELLAGGGLLSGTAYLGIVAFTGWCLVSGLRRLEDRDRLLLAGFGGSWLAYQVQSLVSIDVPPLAALHWIVSGAVIVLARPAIPTTLRLPLHVRRLPSWAVIITLTAVSATGVVLASRHVRADVAAHDARRLQVRGQLAEALTEARHARRLAPWEGSYWIIEAAVLQQQGRIPPAIRAGERAALTSPGSVVYALGVAGTASRAGDSATALRWYREAVQRDPHNPDALTIAGRYYAEAGLAQQAVEWLRHAVDVAPADAEAWRALSFAYAEAGLDDEARAARRKAAE